MSIIEKAVGNLNSNSSVGMQVGRKMNGVRRKNGRAAAPSYQMVEIDRASLGSHGVDWDKSSATLQEFKKIKRPLLNKIQLLLGLTLLLSRVRCRVRVKLILRLIWQCH